MRGQRRAGAGGEGRVIGVVSEADLLPEEEFREGEQSLIEQRRRLADLAKADTPWASPRTRVS